MASFLSVLKRIGTVALGVEHIAGPVLAEVLPVTAGPIAIFDNFVATVLHSTATQEAANPAPGAGASKLAAVTRDAEVALGIASDVVGPLLALKGEQLTYDHALFDKSMADLVSALSGFAAVKASVKITPIPKPA